MNLMKYLGKRFEFADGSAPDVTLISYDVRAGTVRLHCADGQRQTVPLHMFVRVLTEGALLESPRAPFVHDAETRWERAARERAERLGMAGRRGISVRGGIRYEPITLQKKGR
jgi:hypothetical protein